MGVVELKSKAKAYYEDSKDAFEDSKKVFEDFLSLYPFHEHPKVIDTLKPEDIYDPGEKPASGKEPYSSFLYYIEFGLKDFGTLRLGNANYAVNARENINKFKELLKIVVDDTIPIAKKVDANWEEIKFWVETNT